MKRILSAALLCFFAQYWNKSRAFQCILVLCLRKHE
jgi:hypothetical protein